MPGKSDRLFRSLMLTLLLLSLPSAAHANMGPPIFIGGVCFYAWGNFAIGIIEAFVIALMLNAWKTPIWKKMIVANYSSALLGYGVVLVASAISPAILQRGLNLYTMPYLLWTMAILAFGGSIWIEWLFCRKALSAKGITPRTALYATAVAQVVSYAMLIPLILSTGAISLYTDARVTRDLSFARVPGASVYFIAPDNSVCRIRPDGTGRKQLTGPGSVAGERHMIILKNKKTGWWDLGNADSWNSDSPRTMFSGVMKHIPRQRDKENYDKIPWPHYFNRALDLRPEKEQNSDVWCGFWADEGIWSKGIKSGDYSGVALGIPVMTWNARNATVLPGDIVVFELGPQVVVFGLKTRKIGLLALGHGPVAVLENGGLSNEK